jgi:hypothetical protein
MMEHFPEQAWTDFVRGVSQTTTRTGIESHLQRGCSSCKTSFKTWNRLRDITLSEKACAPPESAVHMVKQQFKVKYSHEQSSSVLASLSFDTFTQPLAFGMRSATAVARQLVYEAEGVTVDLRLSVQVSPSQICMVGQVLEKGSASPCNAAIIVWTERGYPLLEESANECGEFQLEFEPQGNMRLSVNLPGRKTIRIPLPNFGPATVTDDITLGTREDYSRD